MSRLASVSAWCVLSVLVAVPGAARQPATFEDVVRNLRNPDAKAGMTQKDAVLDNLDDVIAEVSGDEG